MQMQAPPLPHLNQVTRATLDQLLHQLTPLQLAFDQANQGGQGGGWQRAVAPNISIPYHDKVREVEQQIHDDIDTVDQLCTAHAVFIQGLLDRAKGYIASTKKAIDAYEQTKDEESLKLAIRVTHDAASVLDAISNAAVQADSAYGQAWFPYRGNLGLPDGINQDYFDSRRKDIMARGKMITAKVQKAQQLHEQAKAYQDLSIKLAKLATVGKLQKDDVKQTAVALEAKLHTLLDTGMERRPRMGWDGDGRNWKSKERALDGMAKKPITKKVQDEAASWMADLTANLKIYRNQVKTMETVMLTAKKPLNPKQIESQKKVFATADAHLARAKVILLEAEHIVADAQRHVDIIKRAHV